MRHVKAYLVVICEEKTNKILSADIWSSPEWEQSRQLPNCHVFVAYEITSDSFEKARQSMIQSIKNVRCRYNYLEPFLVNQDS